jgi:hypothetical protein
MIDNLKGNLLLTKMYDKSILTIENGGFPFVLCCLQFTQIILQLMRSGEFTKTINLKFNKINGLYEFVNEMFMSLCFLFFKIWRKGKNIYNFDSIKKEIISLAKKNPLKILDDFSNFNNFDALEKNEDLNAIEKKI